MGHLTVNHVTDLTPTEEKIGTLDLTYGVLEITKQNNTVPTTGNNPMTGPVTREISHDVSPAIFIGHT